MSRKEKEQLESEQTDDLDTGKEIVPYVAPPIPFKVAAAVREHFRLMGVEAEFDDEDIVEGIRGVFPDKSQIKITGGDFGQTIAFQFLSNIPKYIHSDEAIRTIEKKFYMMSMAFKLGYLDIKPECEDGLIAAVSMAKHIDTTNEKTVLLELDRLAKILGHKKPKRRGKK